MSHLAPEPPPVRPALPALDSVKDCPACGHTTDYTPGGGRRADTEYCNLESCLTGEQLTDREKAMQYFGPYEYKRGAPHHHRRCQRCGYRWIEATMLAEKVS